MRYLPALTALALLLGGCFLPSPAPESFFLSYYPAGVCPEGVRVDFYVEVGRTLSSGSPITVDYEDRSFGKIPIQRERIDERRIRFTLDRPALSPRLEEALGSPFFPVTEADGFYRVAVTPETRFPRGPLPIRGLFTFRCGERPPVQVRAEAPEKCLVVVEDPGQESGLRVALRR